MPKEEKEKTLIDLAREHMEEVGTDPESGVDVPESPAVTKERAKAVKPIHKESPSDTEPRGAVEGTIQEAVNSLLSNIELDVDYRPLELPSRGKAYVQSDGFVHIKPFTFAQERKLRSIKKAAQGNKVIKSLFIDCVKGLEYDAMTLEDKNYILFKLREISYGDEYTIVAVCTDCEAKNNLSIEISKIPVTYAEDDYEEPITITLPDTEQEVKFVSPRSKDESYFESMETLTDNLWRFALSVGGQSDPKILQMFFQKTTVRDIAYFREELTKERYGMNKTMSFECAGCGSLSESLIPFTESFFSVS